MRRVFNWFVFELFSIWFCVLCEGRKIEIERSRIRQEEKKGEKGKNLIPESLVLTRTYQES